MCQVGGGRLVQSSMCFYDAPSDPQLWPSSPLSVCNSFHSNTKRLYDAEREKDHALLHSVLQTWKQMKSLRQKQGFTSTPVKLQFHR